MNILLTSVGRRSYIVEYFKQVMQDLGEVHVSNSTSMSPAFVQADRSVVTPYIYEESYIPFLLEYCLKHQIDAIIPLLDMDLPRLAANKHTFAQIGTKVIVSDEEVIHICNDKWQTYLFLSQHGFDVPRTYVSLEQVIVQVDQQRLTYPIIVKPRWGMGSIGVYEAENEEELRVFYRKVKSMIHHSAMGYASSIDLDHPVILQEKINGQEYGIDIINNLEGVYQNAIVKIKYAMRSGETDCAETVDHPELKQIGKRISQKLHHVGNMDVDVCVDGNTCYILELNARFGGGYPFSHLAGVNLPLAIVKWLHNEETDAGIVLEQFGVKSYKDIRMTRI